MKFTVFGANAEKRLLIAKTDNYRGEKFSPAFFKRRRGQGAAPLVAHRSGRNALSRRVGKPRQPARAHARAVEVRLGE